MSARQIIQDFWAGHRAGDHEALKKVLAEDLTWTVAGNTSPIAVTYKGWEGFFDQLLATLAETFVPGSLQMELLGLYADEEEGVGILHLHETATLHNGNSVDQEIVDIITIRDNKIVEVREVMDLAEVNRAFGFDKENTNV